MAKKSDLTTEVLIQIRDELRAARQELGARIDTTNIELASVRNELSERIERLERLQTETELRLASELVAVTGAVHEVRDTLLEDRRLRQQVQDHERRITDLENAH